MAETREGTELPADRELDALVAEQVMGLVLAGHACAAFVEGEWSIQADSTPDRWMCHAEVAPLYVAHCVCATGPLTISGRHAEGSDPVFVEDYNRDAIKRYGAERARFGHVTHCLAVVPTYSTDVATAWLVVEKLAERGWLLMLEQCRWRDGLARPGEWAAYFQDAVTRGEAAAPTAALAICRAALAAVEARPLSPASPTPTPTREA